MSGYSGTPLAKKLGIKDGSRIFLQDAPPDYMKLVSPLPQGAAVVSALDGNTDIIHLFALERNRLHAMLTQALKKMRHDGAIWVSWPKKSSGVATEITENVIRDVALPLGLVDIKVCAVNEVWSGLKFVIRKENR
jgi:hypothetical protein